MQLESKLAKCLSFKLNQVQIQLLSTTWLSLQHQNHLKKAYKN